MIHGKDRVPLGMETSRCPAHIVPLSTSRHAVEKMDGHACGGPHGLKSKRIPILQLQSVVLPGKFGNDVGQELAGDGLQMAPLRPERWLTGKHWPSRSPAVHGAPQELPLQSWRQY